MGIKMENEYREYIYLFFCTKTKKYLFLSILVLFDVSQICVYLLFEILSRSKDNKV